MKTKAHQTYKNKAGGKVPGVTTVLGLLAKPALYNYYHKLGVQGIDPKTSLTNFAMIGTLTHEMCQEDLGGPEVNYNDYTQAQINQARICFGKYERWRVNQDIEVISMEEQLVSEQYQFGGTPDIYCKLNGELSLIDLKTSSGIFPENAYQIAAYERLLVEKGCEVKNKMILRLPKAEEEDHEVKTYLDLSNAFDIFLHCLDIYKLKEKR